MGYTVTFNNKVAKSIKRLPVAEQKKLGMLIDDLEKEGPIQRNWKNFSKLDNNEYHCHLSYSWVACWRHEKNKIIIEVYYVGSREKAPY